MIAQAVCPKAKLYCHDLSSDNPLPIATASQDLIVCIQTLKYLTDANKVIKEMLDKLKPNGIAAFSVSTYNGDSIKVLPEFSFEFSLAKAQTDTYAHPFSSVIQCIKDNGGTLLNEQHENTSTPVQNAMIIQKSLDAGL